MSKINPLKAAAVQLEGVPGAFNANLAAAQAHAEQAFRQGAQIVALPEFFPSPVLYDEPFDACALDAQDNPALKLMRDLASAYGGHIGGSMVLREPHGVFNTYFFVQPDGRYHVHRKDLPTMWENCFYTGGDDDGVMQTDLGGVGAAVCWELIRTQTVQRMGGRIGFAMTGNHWWTVPRNWPLLSSALKGLGQVNRMFAESAPVDFAKCLGVPVLHACHSGRFRSRILLAPGVDASVPYESEFVGATQIVAGDGSVLARRGTDEGAGVVLAEISPGAGVPTRELDPSRFWIPPLTLLHRLYWHHQNACGKSFFRRHRSSVGQ